MRPIKQRPWFIGLLSSLVVDKVLNRCGLVPDRSVAFDREAYDASAPLVPPFADSSVLREDLELPSADGTKNRVPGDTPVTVEIPECRWGL